LSPQAAGAFDEDAGPDDLQTQDAPVTRAHKGVDFKVLHPYNEEETEVLLKTIPLTKGFETVVDDADFDFLSRWSWRALVTNGKVYAIRSVPGRTFLMHRVILKLKAGQFVDHHDRDGLNNTRNNLRPCTQSQNVANSSIHKNNTSGFKGVSFYKRTKQWVANFRQKSLGYFTSPVDAARAYDDFLTKIHGEFALINKKLNLL
jgi:hypothetical protein